MMISQQEKNASSIPCTAAQALQTHMNITAEQHCEQMCKYANETFLGTLYPGIFLCTPSSEKSELQHL